MLVGAYKKRRSLTGVFVSAFWRYDCYLLGHRNRLAANVVGWVGGLRADGVGANAGFTGIPAIAQGTCVAGADQLAVDVEFQAAHANVIVGIHADRHRSADSCAPDGFQDADGRGGGIDDGHACCCCANVGIA